jgi:major membrane immunogen (membrane-anchored lipoprotein)
MKKIITLIFVAVMSLTIVACGNKEYKVDGEFTAFEVSYNREVPMITWVTVTIEKGKVTKYFIDAKQAEVNEAGEFVWNAKSKKELKYDYNMKPVSEIGKEWFEQAEALEAFMLEKGPEAVTTKDGYIDNVTGVSIKDGGYTALTKKAIALIKK